MKDLAYAFTIFFVTLGPIKTIPAFFMLTHNADRRTIWTLALKSTLVATAIVLFIGLVATGMMVKWRVSVDSIAIAGGILLLITSIRTVTGFALAETPPIQPIADDALAGKKSDTRWLGKPVLSPIAIPTIVTPIGVVVILFFAGQAVGDDVFKFQLMQVLVGVMALNFVAMVLAAPVMRIIGVPVLQVIGWVLSAVQAGLAVEAIVGGLRRLLVLP